jgi:putative spermidine/putrescine transport system permease protein
LEASAAVAGRSRKRAARRLQIALYRRPWLRGSLLLSGPLGWMLLIYIAALVVLFLSAFWKVDPFTGQVVHDWGLQNFKTIVQSSTYREIAFRTIGIAAAVTVTDAILAFPFAYFAARLASRRMQTVLFVLVLLPLWSSYLARVYS